MFGETFKLGFVSEFGKRENSKSTHKPVGEGLGPPENKGQDFLSVEERTLQGSLREGAVERMRD